MGNAGNHFDTVLLKRMIHEGKLIDILPTDNHVVLKIKERFNDIVTKDEEKYYTFMGKKYKSHTGWDRMNKTMIWVNQLRFKHFIFEPLAGALRKPKITS